MNIAVVGAGAIGSYLGGMLSNESMNVSLIARGEHLKQMKKNGLTLKTNNHEKTIKATFTDSMDAIKGADLILFTVKSPDTLKTAREMMPFVKKEASILTFQNGVSNEEVLADLYGEKQVLSGAAHISAQVAAPGAVKQEGNHLFFIGSLSDDNCQKAKEVVQLFENSGINARSSDRIIERKWRKSLWNVTFNPLSAVTGAAVGEILDSPELNKTAELVLKEIVEVAKKANIKVTKKAIDQVFSDAALVRHHKTSMLQDREKGKPMEVEALCGYFVKKARRLEVDTPVLETLYSLLTFIDVRKG